MPTHEPHDPPPQVAAERRTIKAQADAALRALRPELERLAAEVAKHETAPCDHVTADPHDGTTICTRPHQARPCTTCPDTPAEPVDLDAVDAPPGDAHTKPTRLNPGLYLSDPPGHAFLAGTNSRGLVVADLGGLVDIGGVHVTSPQLLDQLADRLHMLAGRLRTRTEAPQ